MELTTNHVVKAFAVLEGLPDLEHGFLQHVLLVALQTPHCIDIHLAEALLLVPSLVKGEVVEGEPPVLDMAKKLADLARQDPRFLQNYLDGNPMQSFM